MLGWPVLVMIWKLCSGNLIYWYASRVLAHTSHPLQHHPHPPHYLFSLSSKKMVGFIRFPMTWLSKVWCHLATVSCFHLGKENRIRGCALGTVVQYNYIVSQVWVCVGGCVSVPGCSCVCMYGGPKLHICRSSLQCPVRKLKTVVNCGHSGLWMWCWQLSKKQGILSDILLHFRSESFRIVAFCSLTWQGGQSNLFQTFHCGLVSIGYKLFSFILYIHIKHQTMFYPSHHYLLRVFTLQLVWSQGKSSCLPAGKCCSRQK